MTQLAHNLSVIICAYTEDRWNDLVAAVESMRQQTLQPDEIIVVVDHNPSLLKRVQEDIPDVVLVENKETRGLSGARNSGIAIAQGTLLAFLDDDAIAEPDWLERLSNCCQDPKVLGAGGVVEPLWLSKRPVWFPEEFYWVVGCSYQSLPNAPTVVRNIYGGCTCIRREVFEVVGGFRNEIGRVGTRPMAGEEAELCIRATQHWPHKVFLWDPHARIHHRIPSQRTRWSYFCSRCYAEGLSKAILTRYVGTKDGLAAERSYTLRALPKGVMRGLADTFLLSDLAGLVRAGAIVAGLATTTAGYLIGSIKLHMASSKKVNAPDEVLKKTESQSMLL